MKQLLFLTLLALSFASQSQQLLDLKTKRITSSLEPPTVTRNIDYSDDGILISYKFINAGVFEDDIYKGTYHLTIPGFSEWSTTGMPAVLTGTESLLIPPRSNPTLSIISSKYIDIDLEMSPAREPKAFNDPIPYSALNVAKTKPYTGLWPDSLCQLMESSDYRGQTIANISITPIQYNYNLKRTRIYTEVCLKLHFGEGHDMSQVNYEPASLINPNSSIRTLKKPNSINESSERNSSNIDASTSYLIVSVPEYKETLFEFIKWKKQLGYNVKEIYNENWGDAATVKAAIKEQYKNDSTLMYILIVGDQSKVPGFVIDNSWFFLCKLEDNKVITDFPLACEGGNKDTTADFYIGRWPINNTYDLQTVIDNTIWYEKAPPTNEDFYKQASHFSFFEDRNMDGIEDSRMVKTCEDIRTYMQDEHEFKIDQLYSLKTDNNVVWPNGWNAYETRSETFPDNLLYPNFKWNATDNQLINAIDEGRLYLISFTHGAPYGWQYGNDIMFESSQVQKLRNYEKQPLIFSLGCSTGLHSKSDCIARTLLTNRQGGTFAVFAPTNNAIMFQCPKYASLMINGIWPQPGFSLKSHRNYDLTQYFFWNTPYPLKPIRQLGQLNAFAPKCFRNLSSEFESIYPKLIYHLFGDPSIYFKAKEPQVLDGIEVTRGFQGTHVQTSSDAYIAFYDPINDKSERFYGTEAAYFTNQNNGAKYVDVVVYTPEDIPYIDNGEPYHGEISDTPTTNTRIIGYKDLRNGSVEIEYYLSSNHAIKTAEIHIVNPINGTIESSWPLDRTIVDQKTTIGMRCNSGVMVAYLMVNGAPTSNIKMYLSK